MKVGVFRAERLDARTAAAFSAGALDRPMRERAELLAAPLDGDAVVLGAFQRASELATPPAPDARARRGSGGPAVRAARGAVWVQLLLERPDALTPCDAPRLLNRYVRPLLRALGGAHYFGRDVVAMGHRPVTQIGFAHDTTSGRALVEAIVAASTSIWLGGRASFRDKAPWTVAEATEKSVDDTAIAARAIESFLEAYGATGVDLGAPEGIGTRPGTGAASAPAPAPVEDDPPWTAVREEAIGLVAAGRDRHGKLRVGGELMVARDALASLEQALEVALARGEDPSAAIDAALASPAAALFGVRSLTSIRDVVVAAAPR